MDNRRRRNLLILLLLLFLLYRYWKNKNGNGNGNIITNGVLGWRCSEGWNLTTNYSFNDCENKISLGEISGNPSNPSQAMGNAQIYFVDNWMLQNPHALIDSVKWYVTGTEYNLLSNTCVVESDPPAFYQYFNRIGAQGGMAHPSTPNLNALGNPVVTPSPFFYTWASFIDYLNNNSQFTLTTAIQYTDSYQSVNDILWAQAQYGYSIIFGFGICECIGSVNFNCNCTEEIGGEHTSRSACENSMS